jgi:hypothetical protein
VVVVHDADGSDVVGAQVSVDGTVRQRGLAGSPIELDPGPHVVRVETGRSKAQEAQIVLAAGDKNRAIELTLSRPPAHQECIEAAADGRVERDRWQLVRASELFAVCALPECPSSLRIDCERWFEDTRRRTPSMVVAVHDADGIDAIGAQLEVDGIVRQPGRTFELDPGPHVLHVEAAGGEVQEYRALLVEGERNRRVVIVLHARPEERGPWPSAPPTNAG